MLLPSAAMGADWIRGGENGTEPLWGIRGHLQFAIPPASHGPRGLVRLLYPTLPDDGYDLINFIAVEPIVAGRRGFSELERSRLDAAAGKRFWVDKDAIRGKLTTLPDGAQRLTVVVRIERFDNGAHVKLIVEQQSDRPDEIALMLAAEPDSAPIEYGILTATMGNKARTRLLWLEDRAVSSLELYPEYTGSDFAPHVYFWLDRLIRTREGDLLAAITTDEPRPADARPHRAHWYYGGVPVTQYWKMRRGTWRDDVHVALNARHTYWLSDRPIPGGISFENFEFRERFVPDQQFIFGITRRTPAELGLAPSTGTSTTTPATTRD